MTVPAASVQAERNKIIQKLGGRLKLPGFRKGRIPANVVEQRFGQALDQGLEPVGVLAVDHFVEIHLHGQGGAEEDTGQGDERAQ